MIDKQKLVKIVGTGKVSDREEDLETYSSDISFVNRVRPAYVVKPGTAGEVQKLIELANSTKTPLVPVSSGAPHFKGDTVPGNGGSIIVDLSGMKKVEFVDRARRVAMVEPGVTFEELIPLCTKEGLRLNMPLLPRRSKSVVGSILEREPVLMPGYQWDMSDPLACAGLYFGNGEEFRTGQAAGPGTLKDQWKVGAMQKAPYGPGTASLHRLIQGAQGTMGIVTWVSIRCEVLPKMQEPFFAASHDLDQLIDLMSWLIRLRMVTECFILNNTNLAAIFATDPDDYERIKETLPPYILFYNIAGYDYFPEERITAYIKDIAVMNQRIGLDTSKSAGLIPADAMLKKIQKPCDDPYWKLNLKGANQDIFFLTIYDHLERQISAMKEMSEEIGYSPTDLGLYIQPIVQGTGYHCEFNLFYDPYSYTESDRVKDLTSMATKGLMNMGAFFSRPYGDEANWIFNRDAATTDALRRIKKIFDPNHVMNPGKVCF
jgi:hypothetical protein